MPSRRNSRIRVSRRDTCIWLMPTCSAIFDCVMPRKKRRYRMVRSRSGSCSMSGASDAKYSRLSRRRSSSPMRVDRIGEEDLRLDNLEYFASLAPLIEQLPERERTILYLRFFRGMTQSKIAEHVGISQMHVSRLLTRILEFLREGMEGDAEF